MYRNQVKRGVNDLYENKSHVKYKFLTKGVTSLNTYISN